jgi:D-Tyr-tRNAtyr deacylase
MRAVVQRVTRARVKTESNHYESIGNGILILLGIADNDSDEGHYMAG